MKGDFTRDTFDASDTILAYSCNRGASSSMPTETAGGDLPALLAGIGRRPDRATWRASGYYQNRGAKRTAPQGKLRI